MLVTSSTLVSPLTLKMFPASLTSRPFAEFPRVVEKFVMEPPADVNSQTRLLSLMRSRLPLLSTVIPSIEPKCELAPLSWPPVPTT